MRMQFRIFFHSHHSAAMNSRLTKEQLLPIWFDAAIAQAGLELTSYEANTITELPRPTTQRMCISIFQYFDSNG